MTIEEASSMDQHSSTFDSAPSESIDVDTTMADNDVSTDGLETLPETVQLSLQARFTSVPSHASESKQTDEQQVNNSKSGASPSADGSSTRRVSSVLGKEVSNVAKAIESTVPDLSTKSQTQSSHAQSHSAPVVVQPLSGLNTSERLMSTTPQHVPLGGNSGTAMPASANKITASAAHPKPGPAAAGTNFTMGQSSTQLVGARSHPAVPPKPIPSTLLGYRSASSGAPILIGGVSTPLPQYTIASVPGITPTTSQVRDISNSHERANKRQTTTMQKSITSLPNVSSTVPAKVEYRSTTGVNALEQVKGDEAMKDANDEAENERTRLENRERKKRWREANEDRNKDNDLRCRVNKRAHKLYGKEPSRAKDLWIEEEFNKRKSKRQEKEGKGPDGNLLIEGTDLSSLNHYEMRSVLMSTIADFIVNPAAPTLKDNFDLTTMLNNLKSEPEALQKLFTTDAEPRAIRESSGVPSGGALTEKNVQQMNNGAGQGSSDDEDEEKGPISHLVADASPRTHVNEAVRDLSPGAAQDQLKTVAQPDTAARRFSIASGTSVGIEPASQHQTYGIGSGFESQTALALSSELFRLISMQPSTISQIATATVQNNNHDIPPTSKPQAILKSELGSNISV